MLSLIVLLLAPPQISFETVQVPESGGVRSFPIRVSIPNGPGPFPVLVWSHGLGGSKDSYGPLVRAWTANGYAVVQPTHADSLSLLPQGERLNGLKNLSKVPITNAFERPKQISAILDFLPKWQQGTPTVRGKLDLNRIAVGGHSFGAHTSQLLAGAELRGLGGRSRSFADPRPLAFILISPQGIGGGLNQSSWRNISRPVLEISGDNDLSPRDNRPAITRREVFDNMPAGDKYLGWMKDAHHSFGGISTDQRGQNRLGDPNQVETVCLLTNAFLDAYVKGDASAKQRLKSRQLTLPHPTRLEAK